MPNILDRIVETKWREVAAAQDRTPAATLEARCRDLPACRGFESALRVPGEVRVIAEVKKASPSAGVIRADFDPVAIAKTYEAHGAACLSVLTDVEYFQGSLAYLSAVREAVKLPVLRKDFVVDRYQMLEARAAGADAVLLPRVVKSGATLIGVNNRDLRTFETRLGHTLDLLSRFPPGVTVVSESGIKTAADVRVLKEAGVAAILVGESLMRSPDIGTALDALLSSRG